jgi:hypothetical protein
LKIVRRPADLTDSFNNLSLRIAQASVGWFADALSLKGAISGKAADLRRCGPA